MKGMAQSTGHKLQQLLIGESIGALKPHPSDDNLGLLLVVAGHPKVWNMLVRKI